MKEPVLYIVVPCYNEEPVLQETAAVLRQLLASLIDGQKAAAESRIVFVDDGSRDSTWTIIKNLHTADPHFSGIRLSRNKGHQNALFCGYMYAMKYADAAVSLDADLQDDPGVIADMLAEYRSGGEDGADVVYGVRMSRTTDSWFKRQSAAWFYTLIQRLGVDIIDNHADFRLLSRRALHSLAEFRESNLFLRGIVPLIGYRTAKVYYSRKSRQAGETHYPLRKMLLFAWDAITSFSVVPLRLMIVLGIIIVFGSACAWAYVLIGKFMSATASGWASIMCSIWTLGGIGISCLGVLGEYIGKIYGEVKRRPRYLVAEYLDGNLTEDNTKRVEA